MKVRDMLRFIEEDGWRFRAQKGSHRQYVHPTKKGRVTIPGKPGDDLSPGVLRSIFHQAQIRRSQ
ncbi:MAG: type II toxin-antitoxin system HicA family toxin [Acidobacteriota bacterium]|nr:type II toxin-antitoxin system HicA family toxin [Acidobacteriota bacterium]